MQSASDTPSSHLWALWRSAVWSAAATAGRPRHKWLSPRAGRKGDWDVPFRIPSTATLRMLRVRDLMFGVWDLIRGVPNLMLRVRDLMPQIRPPDPRAGQAPRARQPADHSSFSRSTTCVSPSSG